MSLLSSISSAASSLYYGSGGKGGGTGVPNVVSTFSKIGSNVLTGKLFTSVPVSAQYQNTALGTVANIVTKPASILASAIAPAAVIHSGAIAGFIAPAMPTVGKVATSVLANPGKSVVYGAAAIVGGNILASSSTARVSVANAPSSLANFGTNIGQFIQTPNATTSSDIVKENPWLSAIVATGAGLLIAKGASSVITGVTSIQNTKAAQQNTKQEIENTTAILANNALVAAGGATKTKDSELYDLSVVPPVAPAFPPVASPTVVKAKAKPKKKAKKKAKPKPKKKAKKKAKPKKKSKKYIKKKAKKRKR